MQFFLYIYGTFDSNTRRHFDIKTSSNRIKFDLPSQNIKKQIPAAPKTIEVPLDQIPQNIVYSKVLM